MVVNIMHSRIPVGRRIIPLPWRKGQPSWLEYEARE